MPEPLRLIGKDPDNIVLTEEEFNAVPVSKKFCIDVICNSCGSHSCFFFKKDLPSTLYSFSIGCHDCDVSEDY